MNLKYDVEIPQCGKAPGKYVALIREFLDSGKETARIDFTNGESVKSIMVFYSNLSYAAKNIGKCRVIKRKDEIYIARGIC